MSAIGIGILSFSDPHGESFRARLLDTVRSPLLSFGPDDIALAAAASFTTVALLAILYTAGMYLWRVHSIRSVLGFLSRSKKFQESSRSLTPRLLLRILTGTDER